MNKDVLEIVCLRMVQLVKCLDNQTFNLNKSKTNEIGKSSA